MIAHSDPEHLNVYIDLFDRLLLYNLAANAFSPEAIQELMNQWEKTVKSTIDTESSHRTQFLEATPQGRIAKKNNHPDGEDLRLLFNTTLQTAKHILQQNLSQRGGEDFDSSNPVL